MPRRPEHVRTIFTRTSTESSLCECGAENRKRKVAVSNSFSFVPFGVERRMGIEQERVRALSQSFEQRARIPSDPGGRIVKRAGIDGDAQRQSSAPAARGRASRRRGGVSE